MIKSFRMKNCKISEKTLVSAIHDVCEYASIKFGKINVPVFHKKKITVENCTRYYQYAGGISTYKSHKTFIKPDGGIIFARIKNRDIPILITEDKTQGTNDIYFHNSINKEEYSQRSIGNAFERAAKNKDVAQMLFAGLNIFPYAIFASGCDFHNSHTIADRAIAMNWGYNNHYIDISKQSTSNGICDITKNINIHKKRQGKDCVASIFIKTHEYKTMKYGSSLWKREEIVSICNSIIDLVYEELTTLSYYKLKKLPPISV